MKATICMLRQSIIGPPTPAALPALPAHVRVAKYSHESTRGSTDASAPVSSDKRTLSIRPQEHL